MARGERGTDRRPARPESRRSPGGRGGRPTAGPPARAGAAPRSAAPAGGLGRVGARLADPRWAIPALVLLGALLWALTYRSLAHPIDNIDAEEYAAIARALARGAGFTTPTMPLNGLAFLQGRGFDLTAPWPNITRFPLPSLVMAGLFLGLGATPLAAALSSGLFYLLTVPPLYLLARRVGGTAVALAATLLYLVHPGSLAAATSGLTESASGCLLIASLWLLLPRADPDPGRAGAAARAGSQVPPPPGRVLRAGSLLGLAFWNRQTLAAFALPLGLWLFFAGACRVDRPARLRALGLYLGAAFAVALPWLLRNWLLVGDPTFNLQTATVIPFGTPAGPADFPWYVPEYVPPLTFIAAHPGAVLTKWLGQLRDLVEVLPGALGPPYLFALLLASAPLPYPRPLQGVRLAALGCLVVHATIYSLVGNIERFYSFFLPVAVIFAADALLRWTARLAPQTRWLGPATTAALVAAVGWAPLTIGLGWAERDAGELRGQLGSIVDTSIENEPYLRERTSPDALIASNLPWSVGWQGDRRSVPLPPTPGETVAIETRFGLRFDYIYINPQLYIVAVPAGWREWDRVRAGQAPPPPGFTVERRFGDGSLLLRRTGD